jgi:hypothetical protein
MTLLRALETFVRATAEHRGHDLLPFARNSEDDTLAMTRCRHCGDYAIINSDPFPGESHSHGPAVSRTCNSSQRTTPETAARPAA